MTEGNQPGNGGGEGGSDQGGGAGQGDGSSDQGGGGQEPIITPSPIGDYEIREGDRGPIIRKDDRPTE